MNTMLPHEVAEFLRVSRSTVYRLADTDPSFPAYRLAGIQGLRVDRPDLERWLEQQKQASRGNGR